MKQARKRPTLPPPEEGYRRAIEAAMAAIERENQLLLELRAALLDNDDQGTVAIARRLVGLPPVESKP